MSKPKTPRGQVRQAEDKTAEGGSTACAGDSAGPVTEAEEARIAMEFLAALVRQEEIIVGYLEAARAEDVETLWTPDIEDRIKSLRASNASIRKVEHMLGDLKRLQNRRIEDLLYIRKLFAED